MRRTASWAMAVAGGGLLGLCSAGWADASGDRRAGGTPEVAEVVGAPSVTVYNAGFGVVRESIRFGLGAGETAVSYSDATFHVEPESVMLRDPTGRRALTVLEQNYRNDPLTQELLLAVFEGEEIAFERSTGDRVERVRGRIVRSGYVPHREAWQRYGQQYAARQMAVTPGWGGGASTPIIEVEGELRFGLPGQPIFPSLGDGTILKPTFDWVLRSDRPGPVDAEVAYITGGMSWLADYNVIATPGPGGSSAAYDVAGWVTVDNQTGRSFEHARLKLMAGDVAKLDRNERGGQLEMVTRSVAADVQAVTQQAFDEFHLYTVEWPTTLLDRETKQVEFVRGDGVRGETIFVLDAATQLRGWPASQVARNRASGSASNAKVWIMREFVNSRQNGLGVPLPAGTLRFYERGDDGDLEFIGEDRIDHTPRDEMVRVYTGNAFDLVGERTIEDRRADYDDDWMEETIEVRVRNRKEEPATVRVVERLYVMANWRIERTTHEWTKTDATTMETDVRLDAGAEAVLRYTVRYTW